MLVLNLDHILDTSSATGSLRKIGVNVHVRFSWQGTVSGRGDEWSIDKRGKGALFGLDEVG